MGESESCEDFLSVPDQAQGLQSRLMTQATRPRRLMAWWICERYCVPSRGSGSSAGCSQEALLARCQACRWRAAARLRAHPRTTGESRTCRSRLLAASSLCGAAAPREVVIGRALRTPFSLSTDSTPTELNVIGFYSNATDQRAVWLGRCRCGPPFTPQRSV